MRQIKYVIEIYCELDEQKRIVPVSSREHIEGDKGEKLPMDQYPNTIDMVLMWLGRYLSKNRKVL